MKTDNKSTQNRYTRQQGRHSSFNYIWTIWG